MVWVSRIFNSTSTRRREKRKSWARRAVKWAPRLLLVLLAVDIFYLTQIWPDWERLRVGPVPKSNFIIGYESQRADDGSLPPLRWHPVPLLSIAPSIQRAVVVAEDSRFFDHSGFDLIAFREAMQHNYERRRFIYGASTISQQTVKNLFLTRSRDPLRKWHELALTFGMEFNLSKDRILELYLNVAEFGQGLYGVEAASRHYWGVAAKDVTPIQAVELAATLPSPRRDNPATQTRQFRARVHKISRYMYSG